MTRHRFPTKRRAFTLVEVLVTIVILVVLATMLVGNFDSIINTLGRVRCSGNLKFLHGAFSAYTGDHNMWPQQPEFGEGQDAEYETWWIETMRPYGATETTWQCPTIQKLVQHSEPEDKPRLHYTPTKFDAFYRRPYQWSMMPWLIETADAHRSGALMLFPDGSIRPFSDFTGGQ